MPSFILSLLIFICSHGSKSSAELPQLKEDPPKDPYRIERVVNDTFFIRREIGPETYSTIYIEKNRKSIYYKHLGISDYKERALHSKVEPTKKPRHRDTLPGIGSLKFPLDLIQLYPYKGTLYLYDPCDGIFSDELTIKTNKIIEWSFEAGYHYPFTTVTALDSNTYSITMLQAATDKNEQIIIHLIDPKNHVLAIEHFNGQLGYGDGRVRFYTTRANAKHFDMIVNDCRTQKEFEFQFNPIDAAKFLRMNQP